MPVIDLQKDNEELRERIAELEHDRSALWALLGEYAGWVDTITTSFDGVTEDDVPLTLIGWDYVDRKVKRVPSADVDVDDAKQALARRDARVAADALIEFASSQRLLADKLSNHGQDQQAIGHIDAALDADNKAGELRLEAERVSRDPG